MSSLSSYLLFEVPGTSFFSPAVFPAVVLAEGVEFVAVLAKSPLLPNKPPPILEVEDMLATDGLATPADVVVSAGFWGKLNSPLPAEVVEPLFVAPEVPMSGCAKTKENGWFHLLIT